MTFDMQHDEPHGLVIDGESMPVQQVVTDTAFPIRLSRLAFPLRGPRWQTLAWLPVHVACAAIDGYFEAFFACFDWDSLK